MLILILKISIRFDKPYAAYFENLKTMIILKNENKRMKLSTWFTKPYAYSKFENNSISDFGYAEKAD